MSLATRFILQGQTALVTGGAKGIGAAISRTLAQAGATVVIADLDQTAGEALATALGGRFAPLDVTDWDACAALARREHRSEEHTSELQSH